ncbi:hypothetical protein KSC_106890 [Ktedonobacter sp. SOSP1-52]|uniref:hypothetical protein n=1 Tax=Ktedonobacter sp. SOSP1-52 TaxID=2778366 RepID=UPI001915455D|nr:hypothetical protein [Ktedonobacter sp. SOSP1-52]GHO71797.1 hypothetical protein KSC_106890 [Ktedonobacter sp. SOSP1-52]
MSADAAKARIYICSGGFLFANRKKVGWVVRKEDVASFQQRLAIEPQDKQKKARQENNPYRTLYTIVTKAGQSYNFTHGAR